MKLFVFRLSFIALLLSCNSQSPDEVARAEAMAVAQTCYDRLFAGDIEGFMAFREGMDAMPENYRQQMANTYKVYLADEERYHRGVRSATAIRAQMDTTMNVMQVFMVLEYGNGTQEEIVVPMVSTPEGQWLMK